MGIGAARRRSGAARWARRFGGFSAMLFIVAGLGHRYALVDTISFFWILGIVGAASLAALGAAAVAFASIWERGDAGVGDALAGTLLALLVLAPFAFSAWRAFSHPALTDISTDLVRPPSLPIASAERRGAMNPVVQQTPDKGVLQMRSYPEVTGRSFQVGPERVLAAVMAEIEARRWVLRGPPPAIDGESEISIEVTAYSPLLAFAVDAGIRIFDNETSTYVDMRSVSRYGRHDFGDNARRIAGFLAAISERLKIDPLGEAVEPE